MNNTYVCEKNQNETLGKLDYSKCLSMGDAVNIMLAVFTFQDFPGGQFRLAWPWSSGEFVTSATRWGSEPRSRQACQPLCYHSSRAQLILLLNDTSWLQAWMTLLLLYYTHYCSLLLCSQEVSFSCATTALVFNSSCHCMRLLDFCKHKILFPTFETSSQLTIKIMINNWNHFNWD